MATIEAAVPQTEPDTTPTPARAGEWVELGRVPIHIARLIRYLLAEEVSRVGPWARLPEEHRRSAPNKLAVAEDALRFVNDKIRLAVQREGAENPNPE